MKYLLSLVLVSILFPLPQLAGQDFVIGRKGKSADGSMAPFNQVKAGDAVWIQSGMRDQLQLLNFHGAPGNPVVIANLDGQVVIESGPDVFGVPFRISGMLIFIIQSKR